MRIATVFLATAAASAVAVSALAAPVHLSDADFLEASRCLGILSSKGLGTPDAAALKKYLSAESIGRDGFVYDRADQARDGGERDANRGDAAADSHLVAERDGTCRGFVEAATTTAAAAHAAHTM